MMRRILLLVCMISLIFVVESMAAQRHWVGAGTGSGQQWNKTANWSATQGGSGGAGVPTASDDVFIDGGGDLTINTNAVCLSYNQSLSTGTKDFSNNSTLSVGAGGFTITAGTLTMSGTNNSMSVSGNVTISGAGLTVNGTTPTLTVTGNWIQTGGTVTSTTGVVTFNGTGVQTVSVIS